MMPKQLIISTIYATTLVQSLAFTRWLIYNTYPKSELNSVEPIADWGMPVTLCLCALCKGHKLWPPLVRVAMPIERRRRRRPTHDNWIWLKYNNIYWPRKGFLLISKLIIFRYRHVDRHSTSNNTSIVIGRRCRGDGGWGGTTQLTRPPHAVSST